jgi:hypothetical protein
VPLVIERGKAMVEIYVLGDGLDSYVAYENGRLAHANIHGTGVWSAPDLDDFISELEESQLDFRVTKEGQGKFVDFLVNATRLTRNG